MTSALSVEELTVLVVDDDEYSRDLACLTLGKLGVTQVHVTNDGSDGLCVLYNLVPQPDVLICDILMPEMDGFEMLVELTKRGYTGGVILASSGDLAILNMARVIAKESGLNLLGAFAKPLQRDTLRQALQGWFVGRLTDEIYSAN